MKICHVMDKIKIENFVEDFDKSPALPRRRFISVVLIVSFCFVGDNIFGTGVCWDHHLHPIQGNKIFSSKTRKSFQVENWEILREILCGQNCKSCGRKSWQILHSALCSAPSAAVIGFFKLKSQITRSIIPNYLRDAKKCKWNIKCLKYSSPKHLTVFIL